MLDYTQHTIFLQDGSLFNFKRRFKNKRESLFSLFAGVLDGRKASGKRHPLPLILVTLFSAVCAGNTTIADCWLWGISSPTTAARNFQKNQQLHKTFLRIAGVM